MKEKLLFAGDSITDSGRLDIDDGLALGNGYVRMIYEDFRKNGHDVDIINSGIKGFTSKNLVDNWNKDCIENSPDVVTLLVGVNDVRSVIYAGREPSLDEYRDNLEWLIQETLGNTDAQIILMDTFVFRGFDEFDALREYIDAQIRIIRDLAVRYETGYIDLDGIFARFCNRYGSQKFTRDGIHLTRSGHKIIMYEWMKEYAYIKNGEDNLFG